MRRWKQWGHVGFASCLATTSACTCNGSLTANTEGEASATYVAGPFAIEPIAGSLGSLPEVVNPFPSATTTIHFGWGHGSLPSGEQLTFSLIAVDVGDSAAPNTIVTTANFAATTGGRQTGPAQFSLPRPWPVGSYRVTAVGNTIGPFGELAFEIQ